MALAGQCYFKSKSAVLSNVPPTVNDSVATVFYMDTLVQEAARRIFNGLVRVEVSVPTVGDANVHWSYHMQDKMFTIQSSWLDWGNNGWSAILQDGCDVNVDGACSSQQWYTCKDDLRDVNHQCNNVYAAYFGQAGAPYAKAGVPPGTYSMKLTVAGPSVYTGWETDCMQWPTSNPVNTVSFEVRPNETTVIRGNINTNMPTNSDGSIFCPTRNWTTSYEIIEDRFPGLLPMVSRATGPYDPEQRSLPPAFSVLMVAAGAVGVSSGVVLIVVGLSLTYMQRARLIREAAAMRIVGTVAQSTERMKMLAQSEDSEPPALNLKL